MTDPGKVASMDIVTELIVPRRAHSPDVAAAAAEAAVTAAVAAGVRVGEIGDLDGLEAVYRLYEGIWRPDPKDPPVTTALLRALTKAGNYVAGAFDGPELVGACVGFLGSVRGSLELHSHIAGVSSRALGRSVGFALKLHQRAWALARGVSVVEWTFDPLVRRNAYFNLVKLGARPAEYLPNFYGGMADTINHGDDSDRLLARWVLDAPEVVAASHGKPSPLDVHGEAGAGAVVALGRSEDGAPVVGPLDGRVLLVAVPPDFESLRATVPALARRWRLAVRHTLGAAMAAGGRVTGFDRAGWYVVEDDPRSTKST
jgi:predicted GNAT superfamily acetyltransferase